MVDKKFVVTPWEVTGEVDYERLIRDFGTQHIAGQLAKRLEGILSDAAYLVRRQVFFSHRDLNFVLDDYDNGKRFFLYTGRGLVVRCTSAIFSVSTSPSGSKTSSRSTSTFR